MSTPRLAKLSLLFITLAAAVCLVACSAEIKSGDGGPVIPNPEKPSNKVQGPDLAGDWVSSCLPRSGDRGRILSLKIGAAQTVARTEQIFSDPDCHNLEKENALNGSFTFTAKHGDDIFTLEYRFDRGHGVTLINYENVKRTDHSLMISGFTLGDTAPTVELKPKTQPPAPSPTPTPEPTPRMAPTKEFSPSYGDGATYKGTHTFRYTCQGQDSDGLWTVYKEINGIPRGYSSYRSLASSAEYHERMQKCQSANERVETLLTDLGAFITCRVEDSEKVIWWGNIPIFGLVREQHKDGSIDVTLSSFNYGQ